MAYLYKATNKINGNAYIGISSKPMGQRWKQHITGALSGRVGCTRFWGALIKYGPENFSWEVLEEYDSIEDAKAAEIERIAAESPKYNITRGGDGRSADAANRKSVLCLDDGRTFVSIASAAQFYGLGISDIAKAMKRRATAKKSRRLTAGGRFFEEFTEWLSQEERAAKISALKESAASERVDLMRPGCHMKGNLRGVDAGKDALGRSAAGPMSNARPVLCVDDGLTFESARAASRHYDISASMITQLCRGDPRRKTARGRCFKYAEV